jgi:NAD(P)-dependent dehydrogenase (short-subunit alcohol dehydrogenase family)
VNASGHGRTVLVTGCSSGIGLATARDLRDRDYRVVATARRPDDLERLRAEELDVLALELADPVSVQAAARDALAIGGGRLHGLVNNAAYGQPGAVEDLTREVLREQFETNLFGCHQLTCAVLPAMRGAGQGRIVQVSSVLGLVAMSFRGAYNASKFALEGLSDTLRMELHGSGITVSLIEPGPITSRFREHARAAFVRNVDVESSPFRQTYRALLARLDSSEQDPFTLPPEAVAECIVHALESRRPKPRYYVTRPTWILAGAKRLLSHRGLDRMLRFATRRELD